MLQHLGEQPVEQAIWYPLAKEIRHVRYEAPGAGHLDAVDLAGAPHFDHLAVMEEGRQRLNHRPRERPATPKTFREFLRIAIDTSGGSVDAAPHDVTLGVKIAKRV